MPTCLITGSSRRLGLELCKHFLDRGWGVIAQTRTSSSSLESYREDYENLQVVEFDAKDTQAAEKKIRRLAAATPIDLLVNNASYFEKDSGGEERWPDFQDFYQTHMLMPAMLCYWLYEQTGNNGLIINITDIYADIPNSDYSLYCSTKAGLESLTKSWAKKLAPRVRVNSIQPGPIKFLPSHSDDEKQAVNEQTLLSTDCGFHPIIQGVDFIINNSFVTGSSFKIDGGRTLGKN